MPAVSGGQRLAAEEVGAIGLAGDLQAVGEGLGLVPLPLANGVAAALEAGVGASRAIPPRGACATSDEDQEEQQEVANYTPRGRCKHDGRPKRKGRGNTSALSILRAYFLEVSSSF